MRQRLWLTALIILIGVSLTPIPASGETLPQKLSALRPKLEDADWREREKALQSLQQLETEGPPLVIPEYFRLLRRENAVILMTRRNEGRLDEAFGDPYYSELLLCSWRGYKQMPRDEWYRELAQSAYNLGSEFGKFMADEAPKHLDALASIADHHDDEYARLKAAGLLAHVLRTGTAPKERRPPVLELLARRLDDQNLEVRAAAIAFLKSIGGADVHKLLVDARSRVAGRSAFEIERLESAIKATGPPQ